MTRKSHGGQLAQLIGELRDAPLDLLLGRFLASDEARAECVGWAAGIPIFGLDALSSAAYGPEAALTLLIPLGAAGIAYMVPIPPPAPLFPA